MRDKPVFLVEGKGSSKQGSPSLPHFKVPFRGLPRPRRGLQEVEAPEDSTAAFRMLLH